MHGALMNNIGTVLYDMSEHGGWQLVAGMLVFIFLCSFTVLNMLIGFLCEVVASVTQSEKDGAEVNFLKHISWTSPSSTTRRTTAI